MGAWMNIEDVTTGGQPSAIQPLIGKRVIQAWLLPCGKVLAIRFECRKLLQIEAIPTVGDFGSLQIEVGDELSGADFSDLDELGQELHCRALRGRRLSGLDGDVLVFGDVGAQIRVGGIRWVQTRERAAMGEHS